MSLESAANSLIDDLTNQPEHVSFSRVMALIDHYFQFTPTRFANGTGNDMLINEPGTNEGSCKIFALGKVLKLTEAQTLHCFGDYYRKDVLQAPQGTDHQNIRCFMRNGWKGIQFDSFPLSIISTTQH